MCTSKFNHQHTYTLIVYKPNKSAMHMAHREELRSSPPLSCEAVSPSYYIDYQGVFASPCSSKFHVFHRQLTLLQC
jgi:hypothetical protein